MPSENSKEISKIKEFLKQVDKKYYHRAIQNRQAPVVFFRIGVKMEDCF